MANPNKNKMNQVSPASLLKEQEDTEVKPVEMEVNDTVEETKVAAPITAETKTDPVQVESPVAAPADATSFAALYMAEYIKRYLAINTGYLETEAQRRKAIDAFREIMRYALKNPEEAVLDQVRKMFADGDTRTRILSESIALQGIDRYNRGDQMQMSVFYRIFFDCTAPGKKAMFNMDEVRGIMKNDKLVNYLVIRFGL